MRTLLLYNPIAGAGRGRRLAEELRDALTGAGHHAELVESRLEPTEEWLDDVLTATELLVVIGGDGAMRLASGAAVRTSTPVYHYPSGTENLFAREFGSDRTPARLLGAIERQAFVEIDVAEANGETFLLMASVGFDADVVDDLGRHRGGRISHFSYAAPIVRQFVGWRPPALTVEVDGEPLVDSEPGFLVVANSRQYGWRFDPAARASMMDGLLDVVFFPARSRLAVIGWARRCLRQSHLRHPRLVYQNATRVEWHCQPARAYQLDGDRPNLDKGGAGSGAFAENVRVALLSERLPVLLAPPFSESPQSRPRG